MAMTIITQPGALSLSGNLPKVKLNTGTYEGNVTFQLYLRGLSQNDEPEEISQQIFIPDNNHNIVIDLTKVINEHLSFDFSPNDITQPWQQQHLTRIFYFTVTATDLDSDDPVTSEDFKVIRAGIDNMSESESASDWLKTNFLTWQPTSKQVTYSTPEFLTYYADEACNLRIKVWYPDGTSDLLDPVELSAGVWTIPVSYANIVSLLGLSISAESAPDSLPGAYDVWIEDDDEDEPERLTYIQRYVARNYTENEQWILFENSLGGIDCFRAYGTGNVNAEHEHQHYETEDTVEEYNVNTTRTLRKSTGWLNTYERRWLLDFFPATRKWICQDGTFRLIVITEDTVSYTIENIPAEFEFTFRYASKNPYLNLSRLLVPPSLLNIISPDLQSFSVPPRLVEFQRLDPSEGAMFPVQSPYNDSWFSLSVTALVNYIGQITPGFGHTHINKSILDAIEEAFTTAEKIKLSGIESGAQVNDPIDSMLSDSSEHAVQNKIVKAALDGKKGLQNAVSSPTASGSTIEAIDTISQNTQGVITTTKKTIRNATSSQSGVVSTGVQEFSGNKTFKGAVISEQGIAAGGIASDTAISGGGGTNDHRQLTNRDANNQHPISAIEGLQNALDGKQATISDLVSIRSGASAGATAYQKPTAGIPKSDLASAVQTSLGKADSALQTHQDISGKVDKIDGKGLSTNDYTTAEKNKLANLENYDDTEVRGLVSAEATARTSADLGLQTSISGINSKIPTQATSSNQLADKAFVNSTVQTASANFRGNWSTKSDVPTVASEYPKDYTGNRIPTQNDYLVVQADESKDGGTWRYKYNGDWSIDGINGWIAEYQVNETPMTAAQLAAINSGITDTKVSNINANTASRHSHSNKTLLDTYDQTNGDISDAVSKRHTHDNKNVLDFITAVDNSLSNTSTNPVQNKIVKAALDDKVSIAALSAHTNATNNPHSVTKDQVGLSNVENTSDADKPISTATQTALNAKGFLINQWQSSPDDTHYPSEKLVQEALSGKKGLQNAVSSPTASGSTIEAIDTISQNTQGVITTTKKTIRNATSSQSGVVSTGVQEFSGNKTFKGAVISEQGIAAGGIASDTAIGGGTNDHRLLEHKDANNQHPISAIEGLQTALNAKGYLINQWQSSPDDTHYPSEKLVLNALNGKAASSHSHSAATTSAAGYMSAADKTKLDGVATGATANTGTVTSVAVKMNGSTKGTVTTSGTIDLGTVLTAHQSLASCEKIANKLTSETGWSPSGSVPTDTQYASAKLIRAALDGCAASSHSHSAATTSAAGYMSAADKTKLNGIATGATANTGTVRKYVTTFSGTSTTITHNLGSTDILVYVYQNPASGIYLGNEVKFTMSNVQSNSFSISLSTSSNYKIIVMA